MDLKSINKMLVEQYLAAGSQGTIPETLTALAGHFCDKIRAKVAANPAVPFSALEKLARDSSPIVRLAAAGNPGASRQILETLVHDGDPTLRYELACNIDTPRWMLEELTSDKIAWVRHEADETLTVISPATFGTMLTPINKTGRPCIDICNPYWRKAGRFDPGYSRH